MGGGSFGGGTLDSHELLFTAGTSCNLLSLTDQ